MSNNKEENYTGITDGITDALVGSLFKKFNLDDETSKKIGDIVQAFVENVEVQQIRDETVYTVNLNKLHLTFKK